MNLIKITVTVLLLTFLCMGCSFGFEDNEKSEIPNPVKKVDSAPDFEIINIKITKPIPIDNISYSIISNKIAQMTFTNNGLKYCLRASITEDNFSGLYYSFYEPADHICIENNEETINTVVQHTDNYEIFLSEWSVGKTKFCLSVTNGKESAYDDFLSLTEAIISTECNYIINNQ